MLAIISNPDPSRSNPVVVPYASTLPLVISAERRPGPSCMIAFVSGEMDICGCMMKVPFEDVVLDPVLVLGDPDALASYRGAELSAHIQVFLTVVARCTQMDVTLGMVYSTCAVRGNVKQVNASRKY